MITQSIPLEYQLARYDYPLTESCIAQAPLADRDRSRLMVLHRKTGLIEHRVFSDLIQYLQPADALVLNNTWVIPARLEGRKVPSGGKISLLLLRRTSVPGQWEALLRGSVPKDQQIDFGDGLKAVVREDLGEGRKVLELICDGDPDAILDRLGDPPLPPYIRREATPADRERYQTVYASVKGSVAAPTAGLHFTQKLLDRIRAKGVAIVPVTLHVGRGTFQPVRCEDIREHRMEAEWFEIGPSAAEELSRTRRRNGRIVAVGTTTTRVLESITGDPGRFQARSGWTDLLIVPGHPFKNVDALLTNFHLPKSTLLTLVSAFAGLQTIRCAYAEAMDAHYRFLSFGDAMLIL